MSLDEGFRWFAGVLSQSRPAESHIHFVGVDPAERGPGLDRLSFRRDLDGSPTR
ncbi:hypothetical protein M8C13_33865 [Crossiella sp. SN42]|uniref:hypothetical protein n=1 Tax=Crossiella sp. SN42 TaxID=2944808 RepID=UPI00207CC81A|nr:hypothetical protein [Crossiella sp. SN42]MCO1580755.1 hypothetical protein [Crossiella sp. SN42]